jgi:hypothetical protein
MLEQNCELSMEIYSVCIFEGNRKALWHGAMLNLTNRNAGRGSIALGNGWE